MDRRDAATWIGLSEIDRPGSMPRKSNRKSYFVDGDNYVASITECGYDETGAVRLRITVTAEFGTNSTCILEGLTNREFWHDYPDYDPGQTISITPKTVCELIRYARRNGWDPISSRSNQRIQLTNELLAEIVADTDRDSPPE